MAGCNLNPILPMKSLVILDGARTPFCRAGSSLAEMHAADLGRLAAAGALIRSGFDPALWQGLAELGALSLRVPEEAGGLGLGLFDAAILMEEAGRTLASGPLAEALVAARLLAQLGGAEDLLGRAISGETVVTIAMRDLAEFPRQWVAGGLVAEAVVARKGSDVVLIEVPADARVLVAAREPLSPDRGVVVREPLDAHPVDRLLLQRVVMLRRVAEAGQDANVVSLGLARDHIAQVDLRATERPGRIGVGDAKQAHARDVVPQSGPRFSASDP